MTAGLSLLEYVGGRVLSLFGYLGEMVGIIEGLAKEKGLDLVLDLGASGTVFFNPAMDITAEVISRYDAAKAAAPKK